MNLMTVKKEFKNPSAQPENHDDELKILNIRGEMYRTRLTRKFSSRTSWKKPDEKQLLSFIPGTICQIFVKPGDRVDTDTRLMILEAMKMQNVITSPVAGKIKSVLVKEGEKIRKGIVMLEFE
jgi:biotin carboxyl carrier protein